MTEILKWIAKSLLTAVFWVFILSIQVQGRPLFFTAHEVLIQNDLVRELDGYLVEFWDKASKTAKQTYKQVSDGEKATF